MHVNGSGRSPAGLSRRRFIAAAGGAAAALASGCGGAEFAQVPGSVPRDYQGRIHVVFWYSFGATVGAVLSELVDEFNAQQDDIYVELQYQGNYEQTVQKLSAVLVAQQVPTIATLSEVTWRKMHLADKLEPLNDYFGDGFTPDVYEPNFLDEGTVRDVIWWLPFARSTPLFYYNKDMFVRAGLPEEGPTNWRELKEWAPTLKEHAPYVLALAGTYASWYFHGNIWQWGGNFSDGLTVKLDSDEMIEAMHWMVDFIREDDAAYLATSTATDFQNEITACTMASTGSLANIYEGSEFEVGTAFLPEYDHFGCPTGGAGVGILRDSAPERKEAAFELIKFLSQPANAARWTVGTGYMPAVTAAQEEPLLMEAAESDPNYRTALEQLPLTSPQDLIRTVVPAAGEMMDQAFQRLYSSNASVEDVLSRLNKRLERKAELISETYEARYT